MLRMDQVHKETYRGHDLHVWAHELRPGVWEWVYLVDSKHSGTNSARATLPDSYGALQRGLLAALSRADEIETKG